MSSHDQGSHRKKMLTEADNLPRMHSQQSLESSPEYPFLGVFTCKSQHFSLNDPEVFLLFVFVCLLVFVKDREDRHLSDHKMDAENTIFIIDIFKVMQMSCVGTRLTPMNSGFICDLFLCLLTFQLSELKQAFMKIIQLVQIPFNVQLVYCMQKAEASETTENKARNGVLWSVQTLTLSEQALKQWVDIIRINTLSQSVWVCGCHPSSGSASVLY